MEKIAWAQNSKKKKKTLGQHAQSQRKEQAEDSFDPKRTERKLGKSHPEIVDIPVIAAHAAVRESGRVLEKQNRDLWTRPTDQPWHFPSFFFDHLWVAVHKCRRRSLAKLEAKKQKSLKNGKNWIFSQMEAAILDLDHFILTLCLARMEPRWSAWAFWLTISWTGELRSNTKKNYITATFRLAVRPSWWILTWASMATKMSSVCDGVHLLAIAATCLDDVRHMWRCHHFFACNRHETFVEIPLFILFQWHWLKPSSLGLLSEFLPCALRDHSRSLRLSLFSFIILTGFVSIDPDKKRIITVVLGSCLVSIVFSSRTVHTERTYSHPHLVTSFLSIHGRRYSYFSSPKFTLQHVRWSDVFVSFFTIYEELKECMGDQLRCPFSATLQLLVLSCHRGILLLCFVVWFSVHCQFTSSVVCVFQQCQLLLHGENLLVYFSVFVFSVFLHFSVVVLIPRSRTLTCSSIISFDLSIIASICSIVLAWKCFASPSQSFRAISLRHSSFLFASSPPFFIRSCKAHSISLFVIRDVTEFHIFNSTHLAIWFRRSSFYSSLFQCSGGVHHFLVSCPSL